MLKFTLIELLVVIFVIVLLVGMVSGGYMIVMNKAKRTSTLGSITNLNTAIEQYHAQYSYYPFTPSQSVDVIVNSDITNGYSTLLETMRGANATLNPRKHKFLEISADGSFKDAWGEDLVVSLDLNYDDSIDDEVNNDNADADNADNNSNDNSDGENIADNDDNIADDGVDIADGAENISDVY